MFSSQQLQHLLKFMPGSAENVHRGSHTKGELEMGFSGMVTCNLSVTSQIDSCASDYMTSCLKKMVNVKLAYSNFTLTLPIRYAFNMTHVAKRY